MLWCGQYWFTATMISSKLVETRCLNTETAEFSQLCPSVPFCNPAYGLSL